ncbi:sensor histidine kinase [Haliscomenobacter hydrossis]|nr:HAMP domain-containing sensor histidine kinase [Haliscomenobacter hydrossis]
MYKNNTLYRALMGGSLLLLAVFQIYWLNKVYQEQEDLLRHQSENVFIQTVRDLQDSLIQRKIVFMEEDPKRSIKQVIPPNFQFEPKTPPSSRPSTMVVVRMDSVTFVHRDTHPEKRPINFYLRRQPKDDRIRRSFGLRRGIGLALSKIPKGTDAMFELSDDTIPKDQLIQRYQNQLKKNDLPLAFSVTKIDSLPDEMSKEGIVHFAPAGIPPFQFYRLAMEDYQWFLLKRMTPQMIFGLFLLLFTGLTFWVIFRSLRQQQQLTRLKNDFISNITHELKTPIATVSVALEALKDFNALNNPQRTREYIDISQHEMQRLSMLVDRVLKMSMFESQTLQIQREPLNLKSAIQKILESLSLQFEKQRAKVSFTTEGNDFQLNADPIHLTNVVYNLLDNALKYSKEEPKIDIALTEHNGTLTFSVKDQGIGIPKEYQGKVFDQFFRVPHGDKHNVKGYGLGLSYVAGVIQQHGGQIMLDSEPDKGTRFTVFLPRYNN